MAEEGGASDGPVKTLTKRDKTRLRQIQKEVTWMGYGFWTYAFLDFSWSIYSLIRTYNANRFMLKKQAPKTIVFTSMRLFLAFEASNYLKNQHLLVNAKPILRKKTDNPRR